jgi:hypothetical protein
MPHIIYLDSPEAPAGLLEALRHHGSGSPMIDFPAHLSVPEICLRINNAIGSEAGPVMVVSSGVRCQDLPAFARAQSAVHRSIISYALIDPDFPPSTDQWPAAPVTVYLPIAEEPGRSISLRGFHIHHFTESTDLANQVIDQANSAQ